MQKFSDEELAEKWREGVRERLRRLPMYDEAEFGFEIEARQTHHDGCNVYYYVQNGKFCSYFYDRGIEKKSTKNIAEAVYSIVENRIFNYALQYEAANRVPYVDCRRQQFALEQEMYDAIGEPYGELCRKKQAKILLRNPFNDAPAAKLDLLRDFESAVEMIKAFEHADMLKHFPAMTALLDLRRENKGIPNFDGRFARARGELINFYNFLLESNEDPEPFAFLELVEHIQKTAKQYIDAYAE